MRNVYFEPWVGNDYWNNGGIFNKKILIIGNNHYCDRDVYCEKCGVYGYNLDDWKTKKCSSMTQTVIKEYIDYQINNVGYEKWMATFSRFEKSLNDSSDSKDIWNSVAFYNYLQSAINGYGEKSSSQTIYRKYYKDYCDSENALWEVIDNLKPNYIFVWGSVVRNHIGNTIQNRTSIPTLMIHHPSQGYDILYWKKEISDFLS